MKGPVNSMKVRIDNVDGDIFKVKTADPNSFQQHFFSYLCIT